MNRKLSLLTFVLLMAMVLAAMFLSTNLFTAQEEESLAPSDSQALIGTSFTYQGRLTDNGSPVNGDYDFQFILYDAEAGGSQVGSLLQLEDEPVTEGLFTVLLDFGAVFDGTALWLEIGVRPGAETDPYTTLSPRRQRPPRSPAGR